MAVKKSSAAVYPVIIMGFVLLITGMGLEGTFGIAVTGFAILLFLVAIIMSVAGGSSDTPPPSPPS